MTSLRTTTNPQHLPPSPTPKIIYNQKWECYLSILIASLVNFASISEISLQDVTKISLRQEKILAIFGAVSCLLACLILIFDRITYLHKKVDFQDLQEGKMEGYTLLFLSVWWIVGVGIMTRAGGIAYRVLNTYTSAWFALAQTILTLNQWSKDKDIISLEELMRLSQTLKYWYMLLLASLVEMGSAIDVLRTVNILNAQSIARGEVPMYRYHSTDKGGYSIAVGAVSVPITLVAIMIHYQIVLERVKPGKTIEMFVALGLCIWWIVAVSVLTSDEASGSTLQGTCTSDGTADAVGEHAKEGSRLLGSNLYLSLWIGLYSAFKICLEWKAQRAMRTLEETIINNNKLQIVESGGGDDGDEDVKDVKEDDSERSP